MISKNELKYIQSLCQKKQRTEEGLFIAEGTKLVSELLNSNYRVKKIYATEGWISENRVSVEVAAVTEFELEKMSSLQTPNEVLAVCYQNVEVKEPVFKNTLSIVLDGIQDPGNMGTIIRIADWFGIHQIIASEDCVELYNPKVIQSTMGSFMRVRCWYKKLNEILPNAQVPVYGALLQGKSVLDFGTIQEGILIIGNESRGIRDTTIPLIQHPITIPRIGEAESLNAAVATGILLSHLCLKS